MAKAKDKDAKDDALPKSLDERQAERFQNERSGVQIGEADREVLNGTLEERGAALDADLKRMGVR